MKVYLNQRLLVSALMVSSLILVFASVLPHITQTIVVGIVYAQGNIPVAGATLTAMGSKRALKV
jgi:hypothetical protein